MKKKLGKLTTFIAVLVILALIATGCDTGGSTETTNTSESKDTATKAPSTEESEPTQAVPELDKTVPLRIANNERSNTLPFEEGATTEDNQFLNRIKEVTGYANLEWDLLPTDTYYDLIKLSIASGDTYDLIYNTNWKELSKQDVLLDLNDLLDEYGKAILENTSAATIAAAQSLGNQDGKLFCIPSEAHVYYEAMRWGNAFVIRKDIIDSLSLDVPTTTDELYTFLTEIKSAGYIPYVAGASGRSPMYGLDVITAAFGCDCDSSNYFVVQDGELVDIRDQSRFEDCLTYLNMLYTEGLIDNEYLYNTTAKMQEKITSSQAVCFYDGPTNIYNYKNNMSETVPDVEFKYVSPITGPEGYNGYTEGNPIGNTMCIPSNAKYPEQAVDLVNLYYGDRELQMFVVFGEEGRDYNYDEDGNMIPTENYDLIKYKLNYRLLTTWEDWQQLVLLTGCKPEGDDFVSVGPHLTTFNIEYYMPTADAKVEYAATQSDLFNEYIAKIITGALPISALSDYLTEADANGRQEIISENLEWFEGYGKEMYEDLMGE